MQLDFVKKLKGTRADAAAAAEEIKKNIEFLGKKCDVEGRKNKLKFCGVVMRNICVVIQATDVDTKHIDIYCDIVEKTILPNVSYFLGGNKYWDTFLGCLRYLHYILCSEKTTKELQRIHEVIQTNFQRIKLQTETDYRYYLDVHVHHINYYFQSNVPISKCSARLEAAVLGIVELFEEMQLECQINNRKYPDIMAEMNKLLLSKRSASFIKYFSSIPTTACQQFFSSLFKLLALNTLSNDILILTNLEYLGSVISLLQIDAQDQWLQQQYTLHFLRSCRELYKDVSPFNYFYQLLYYYIKLIYVRVEVAEFQRTYIELCRKFINYFDRVNETKDPLHEKNFHESMVAIQRVIAFIEHFFNIAAISYFRQQMASSIQLYNSHFDLIMAIIKHASRISSSQLASGCNNSDCYDIRKHIIYSCCACALSAFATFVKQQSNLDEAQYPILNELNQKCLYITGCITKLIERMPCLVGDSSDIYKFCDSLSTIGKSSNTPHQTAHFFNLIELLPKIRHKISDPIWVMLLRSAYKASAYSNDSNEHKQMHCIYIAALAKYKVGLLRNQIGYYFQTAINADKCITETLTTSQSPLKPELTVREKRFIYAEEFSCVLRLYKQRDALLKSLMHCAQTTYEYVNIARFLKSSEDIKTRLKKMHASYKMKCNSGQLTRLQNLEFGHICTLYFNDLNELQKNKVDIAEIAESNLEESIANQKDLIKVDNELKRLDIAEQAVRSFEEFFYKADESHIDSEQAIIDWEAIMEDINSVASTLQLMGYTTSTASAWLLQMRIAELLGERFNYIRAASFFFGKSELFERDSRICLKLELSKVQIILEDLLPQLNDSSKMFKRNQTLLMICLCQMANYYSKVGKLSYAQLLLSQVAKLRNSFEERKDKFDIVSMTIQSINFRIHCQNLVRRQSTYHIPNVMRIMDNILERLRHFVSISSVDSAMFMLIAIELVQQSVECSANRLGERVSFVYTTLNMSLQAGLALRAIQVLCLWFWSNLQLEQLEKAQSKLRLIEHFYGIETLKQTLTLTNEKYEQNEKIPDYADFLQSHLALVEPIRKQNIFQQTPLLVKQTSNTVTTNDKLDRFLVGHQKVTDNAQLQWQYFIAGCLSARLSFLAKEYGQLDNFYASAKEWIDKQTAQDTFAIAYMNIHLLNSTYFVNYLRFNKNYTLAASYAKGILSAACVPTVDINYRYNLGLQLKTVHCEEQLKCEKSNESIKSRRALDFINLSPDDKDLLTACEKSLGKKKIKRPGSKENDIWTNEITFEIEQILESNKNEIKSVKKTKIQPKQAKKLNTRKNGQINSGDSSTDYNSHTPSSDDGVDMNACQIIDTSDLDESTDPLKLKSPTINESGKILKHPTNYTASRRTKRKPVEPLAVDIVNLDDVDNDVIKSMARLTVCNKPTQEKLISQNEAVTAGRGRGTKLRAATARQLSNTTAKTKSVTTKASVKSRLVHENLENVAPTTALPNGVTTRRRQRT